MLLLLVLMLGFDLWSPQSNPVSDRLLGVTVQPFAVMDSKVKDKEIFTGGLAVENLTDQPFTFAAIKLAWKDGEELALTQDEIRTSLKAGNWLTNVAAPETKAEDSPAWRLGAGVTPKHAPRVRVTGSEPHNSHNWPTVNCEP